MDQHMHNFLRAGFWHKDSGTTAVEYALIVAFVVTAIVGAIQALGNGVTTTLYNNIATLF